MLTVLWLAITGLPVFEQPFPEAPHVPAAVAVATDQVSLRTPCYSLMCSDAEWLNSGTSPALLSQPAAPGTAASLKKTRPASLATRRYTSLSAPVISKDWINSKADKVAVGTTYGMNAFHNPSTNIRLQLGGGYRIEPYSNYGTATAGPVARGSVEVFKQFGERTRVNQSVMVETGRENTFLRQTIGVDFKLQPQWTLKSRVEMNHDSGAYGNSYTDTQGSLNLHYSF